MFGASLFNVTWTSSVEEPRRSRKGMGLAEITRTISAVLDAETGERRNVIVRPYGPDV
jgi:hypothetical protein